MSKLGRSFVRLRTVNGRHIFTLKRPEDNELACVEYESQVADREQMHGAITAMGFYPTTRVVKDRRTGRWGDLSVCVDEVDGVGVYFEVENVIGPGESGTSVQDELAAWCAHCRWSWNAAHRPMTRSCNRRRPPSPSRLGRRSCDVLVHDRGEVGGDLIG
jgi:adenylate cyclase class IV